MGSSHETWDFEAIGVPWQIQTPEPLPADVERAVGEVIAAFDADWSRFRGDSLVRALARSAGSVAAPPDTVAMLDAYAALSAATDGAVNPLVGASLESLGYDSDVSLRTRGAVPAPADWREIVSWDADRLALARPALLDVGALGKGRLVDRVVEVIAAAAPGDVVVDASGDIAIRGAAQSVALEHPFDPRRAIGVWAVGDAAICASATNRRAWGDGLHHVLDARTGRPVRTIAATWAVADTAMRADAIATALFFDGGPRLAGEWGVQWVRMTTDGRVEWSPGCRAELFLGSTSVEG